MATGKTIKSIIGEQRIIRKKNSIRLRVDHGLLWFYGVVMLFWGELKSSIDLSWKHTLKAWRHGFTRFTYRMYGLDRSGILKEYLSDYQAIIRGSKIYGKFDEILLNKWLFSVWLKQQDIPGPDIKGVICRGRCYPFQTNRLIMEPTEFLNDVCKAGDVIVLKPIWYGAHGNGIIMVARTENGYRLNGENVSTSVLIGICKKMDNYIVTEFIRQAEYATRFFPDTTNTIRILTLRDIDTSQSIIARAVHRIGTTHTRPVDNFRAGRGGLSALINPDTGELGQGAMVSTSGGVTWHTCHPESGAPIQGVFVPAWMQMRKTILAYADRMAFIPAIAWDIAVTPSGLSIIEANLATGMSVLQVHGSLLTDPRIRRFFTFHGIIS